MLVGLAVVRVLVLVLVGHGLQLADDGLLVLLCTRIMLRLGGSSWLVWDQEYLESWNWLSQLWL